MTDPRAGKPSASSFAIVASCPGQPQLKASLPAVQEPAPDPDSERGTRIHRALETGDSSELEQDEFEDMKAVAESANRTLNGWMATWGFREDDVVEKEREARFWLNDPSTAEPILSGQLDRHYLSYSSDGFNRLLSGALVIDYKTGWNRWLTPSQRNLQLRIQAVLVWREYDGIKHVRVALATKNPNRLDFTDYTENDLIQSEQLILHQVWLASQPNAPRSAGMHCNWCPCKAHCPEAAAYSMLPSVIAANAAQVGVAEHQVGPKEMVAALAPADLALVFQRSAIIRKILDEVNDRLKGFTDEQLKAFGLTREPGRKLDPIADTRGAFEHLKAEYGISEDELWKALSFSKGELVKAIQRDQGWPADKTRAFINGAALEHFIERKRSESSLSLL